MNKSVKINTTFLYLFCTVLLMVNTSIAQNKKSFLDPPEIIKKTDIGHQHSPENRKFTGISSLAVSPGGRMWAVWYAGITPGEDINNYVVVATSGDKGEAWEEVLVIDPDGPGPVRSFDPEVWTDPDGKLWIFWAQAAPTGGTWSLVAEGTLAGVWALKIDDPETNEPELNTPFRITDGVMMCKPIVLSTGEWVLPVSFWRMEKGHARMVVSDDDGQTWEIRGGASVPDDFRSYDEHMIVERKDGSLWMLIRTRYGVGESTSNDRGFTWSPVIPSKIQHPSARFFIYRLFTGNLLLVKHGPIGMRTGRSHLMAFVSKDDGYSWSNGLLLDERPGVSYPDGQQINDGTIHITYDYNRTKDQHILVTSFTEDDIKTGSDNKILEVFKRRQLISQGGTK